jgi:hypothetical protein
MGPCSAFRSKVWCAAREQVGAARERTGLTGATQRKFMQIKPLTDNKELMLRKVALSCMRDFDNFVTPNILSR